MCTISNRTDISAYILKIEEKFPVNDWKCNDIHIWPYLRIKLFLYLIYKIEAPKPEKEVRSETKKIFKEFKPNVFQKIISYTRLFSSYIKFKKWYNRIDQADFLFVGSDSHRINYNNKRFNRYFDSLILQNSIKPNSRIIEYGNSNGVLENDDIIIKYQLIFPVFISYQNFQKKLLRRNIEGNIDLRGYQDLLEFLLMDNLTKDFATQNSFNSVEKTFKETWTNYFNFFTLLLKKLNPKKVTTLCYYDFQITALVAAANKLNIPTIEMQHGPQPETHLAYGNWLNIPKQGYDILPRVFWCWDDVSRNNINKWAVKNGLYSAVVGGNPWLNFWEKQKSNYKYSNYILYSLQPDPVSIEQLFSKSIIDFIKKENFKWFIRLHPRQISDKHKIENLLAHYGVLNLVNINDGTNDPLPQLLNNCCLHVTHFSGTTIEADLLSVYTVLLSKTGLIYYDELINKKTAEFIDPESDNFSTEMLKVLSNVNSIEKKPRVTDDLSRKVLFN